MVEEDADLAQGLWLWSVENICGLPADLDNLKCI